MEPDVTYAQVAFSKASEATYAQVFSKDSDVTYAELRLPPTAQEKGTEREAQARTAVPAPGKPPAAWLAHTTTVKALGVLVFLLLVTAITMISLLSLFWSCQQGWTLHSRHCYYVAQDTAYWQLAKSKCEDQGAQMLIVNSMEEQDFVNSRLANDGTSHWIGYSKHSDQWLWVDGSSTSLWFWKAGQPDNYQQNELCATTSRTWNRHSWNDDNCWRYYKYICEKDANHMKINIYDAR